MAVMRVTTTARFAGQKLQNVLHFRMVPGALTFQQVAENIRDIWIQNVKTFQVTDHIYESVAVSQIGAGLATFTLPVNIPGTNIATQEGTPFECIVIQTRTAVAGRHGHGRIYFGGLTTNVADKGIIKAPVITAVTNVMTTLKNEYVLAGGGGPLKLLVFPKGGDGEAGIEVTDMVIRPWYGVQRRRNHNVGI